MTDLPSSVRVRGSAEQEFARYGRMAGIAIWAIIIAIVAIRVGLNPTKNTVFKLFYDTGLHWRRGEIVYEPLGLFRYSPLVAGSFGILSFLPFTAAQLVWMSLNLGVLFAGLGYWLRTCPPRPLRPDERWGVVLLATPLMVGNINNLQANPMLLGFLLLGIAWTQQRRWNLAAMALAAAAFLKVYPLAMGLILMLLFPKQLSWRLLLALVAGVLVSFLLQSQSFVLGIYHQWFQLNSQDNRVHMDLSLQYQDATILWARYVGTVSFAAMRVWQGTTAALVAATALWARRMRMNDSARLVWITGLVFGWMLLGGPSTESSTYILVAPLAAYLVVDTTTEKRPLLILAWLCYLLLIIAAMSSWFPFGTVFKSYGWQPVATLLIMVALFLWRRRWRNHAAGESSAAESSMHLPRVEPPLL